MRNCLYQVCPIHSFFYEGYILDTQLHNHFGQWDLCAPADCRGFVEGWGISSASLHATYIRVLIVMKETMDHVSISKIIFCKALLRLRHGHIDPARPLKSPTFPSVDATRTGR